MSGQKFIPQFAGDVDPTEFMDAMTGDVKASPMTEAFRGMDSVTQVHEEIQPKPQASQAAPQGDDLKEAVRGFILAGQKLLEALEKGGRS